jgi:predicted phage terminase large subunit-like protein
VLDEAAFMRKTVWTQSIRPMLSDKQGWAIFPTTPNGFNWFKDLCDTNATSPGWRKWHMPSWTNPIIPMSEFDAVRAEIGALDFRQEYGAEFVREAASEFGEYLTDDIWWDGEPPADAYMRLIAVDASKGKTDKSDFTAIVAGYFDPRGYVWVDAEIERMNIGTINNRAVAWCRYVNPHGIVFETNQFQEMLCNEFQQRAHEAGVRTRVDGLDNTENKRLRIRRSLSTWLEFGKIKFRKSRGGMLLVEQLREFPIGEHDDGPDALEMLIRYFDQVRGFLHAAS